MTRPDSAQTGSAPAADGAPNVIPFRLPTLRKGAKGRILSGMRPTGKLHLGNYVGALQNWVALQDEYENFHMVADWHALTTGTESVDEIQPNTYEMVLDWLAAGIDPAKSPIFVQSHVKEHAELHLLFSMLITKARLERNPTLKDQVRDLGLEESTISYGHLGYACLQAADILLYRANAVPVGEDQVPHVEITREIARRFNYLYCEGRAPVFPEPEARLTKFPRLRGLDGNRMSKSVGNTILLSDTPEEIFEKVRTAYTDPLKIRKTDPGHPEGCVVFEYHRLWNPEGAPEIDRLCRAGQLGCVEDKKNLATILADRLAPIRERRAELAKRPDDVWDVIHDGDRRAREEARATMHEVREAMKLVDPKGGGN
ncbi:MAG: tryptophan--tRNA ligase [Candidatus Eiseniibacteriota bacterium]